MEWSLALVGLGQVVACLSSLHERCDCGSLNVVALYLIHSLCTPQLGWENSELVVQCLGTGYHDALSLVSEALRLAPRATMEQLCMAALTAAENHLGTLDGTGDVEINCFNYPHETNAF